MEVAPMLLAMHVSQIFVLTVLGIVLVVGLILTLLCARTVSYWLRAFLSGAPISLIRVIAMQFRRIPVDKIVRLHVMAVQAGLQLQLSQIESAYLQGVDVELAILALIEARSTGKVVTWEDAVAADVHERLRAILFSEHS